MCWCTQSALTSCVPALPQVPEHKACRKHRNTHNSWLRLPPRAITRRPRFRRNSSVQRRRRWWRYWRYCRRRRRRCVLDPAADTRPPPPLGHLASSSPASSTQRHDARQVDIDIEVRREARVPPHEQVAEQREETGYHYRASVGKTDDVRGVDVTVLEQRRFED